MSLRVQITLLFAALLVGTMAVAATFGAEMSRRAVDDAVRERTVEVARGIASELALERGRVPDSDEIGDRLTAAVPFHHGVRVAELLVERGGTLEATRFEVKGNGAEVAVSPRSGTLPQPQQPFATEHDGTPVIAAEVPLGTGPGKRPFALLHVEADVSDARHVARRERNVFLWVTVGSTIALAGLFVTVLGPMLVRPLTRLADAMERFESGAPDPPRVPGAERTDEIGVVARGLAGMLTRIRSFSAEMQARVEDATRDLAARNRDLAELNALLVDARRDLTAKERLAALGQLSGTIAHELGNPLNAMSTRVQLLARDPAAPPAVAAELTALDADVKRMTAVIRRFLDSARALTPAPEPTDVPALVEEALSLSLSAEARSRISVVRELAPDLGRPVTDPALVRHVLTNLVSNAADAMPRGGTLTLSAARRGEELAIAVADTGAGIPPDDRRRIFEPFYSTKPPGRGTGLGLAICREIASALKGRIEVESEPGRGARFTLLVPAVAGAARRHA